MLLLVKVRGAFYIFYKKKEMAKKFNDIHFSPIIGDVLFAIRFADDFIQNEAHSQNEQKQKKCIK